MTPPPFTSEKATTRFGLINFFIKIWKHDRVSGSLIFQYTPQSSKLLTHTCGTCLFIYLDKMWNMFLALVNKRLKVTLSRLSLSQLKVFEFWLSTLSVFLAGILHLVLKLETTKEYHVLHVSWLVCERKIWMGLYY